MDPSDALRTLAAARRLREDAHAAVLNCIDRDRRERRVIALNDEVRVRDVPSITAKLAEFDREEDRDHAAASAALTRLARTLDDLDAALAKIAGERRAA